MHDEAAATKSIASLGKDQLTQPLRIGAIFTVGPYLFPHLIRNIRPAAPHMPLVLEENYTSVLRQKLRNGELDVIIISPPFTEPDTEVVTAPSGRRHHGDVDAATGERRHAATNPLHDLHLMSLASHHIIANSSFSWWAAWLGDKPGHQVIMPNRWYAREIHAPMEEKRQAHPRS